MNLFHRSPAGPWLAHPLNGHQVAVSAAGLPDENLAPAQAPFVLIPHGRKWILLASADASVTVNGHRVALGMVQLRDRDEIVTAPGSRLYFSTETQEKTEPFPGLDSGPGHCPRCRLVIETGAMAVRCGGCGVWEHAGCWSYAPTCAACPRETDPEAGLTFNPESL